MQHRVARPQQRVAERQQQSLLQQQSSMGAGRLEAAQKSTKLADLTENSEYAPLLPKASVSKDGPTATASAIQPPVAVSVQRDDDKLKTDVANASGYQTGLCDCCAEPGGVRLCERLQASCSANKLCLTLLAGAGCYGCWCEPCLFGQNVEKLGPVRWLEDQAAPSVVPCWAAAFIFGLSKILPGGSPQDGIYLPWALQTLYRRRIRRRFKIVGHGESCGIVCPGCWFFFSGDACADCCSSFWCLPCALCQDAREIAIRGNSSAPTVPAATMTAPSSQDMTSV